MAEDLYVRPISAPSSVESFPTAPPGSLEYDMAISARKKARTLYYIDTTSRHVETPQLFAKKHEIVDSLSVSSSSRSLSTARSLNDRAESFLDYVHSIVWGSSKDNTGVTHEDSSGSPISGTPKLLSPKQHEMALANAQAIIKALDQMNKELQQIQEVNKEQYADMVSASVTQALYAFHELLKKQGALKKDEQLLGTQGINLLHQETRENHEKRKILHEALEESLASLSKLDKFSTSAKFLSLASAGISVLTATGGVTLNPAFVAVGALLNIILLGITGGTTLAKTKQENLSTEQTIEIKQIDYLRVNATHQSKDHTHDIKSAGSGITNLVRIEAEELDKSKRMLELLKSMAPGAA
ncbi:MAG: hypothetical protein H0T62_04745 [Parachlamydiaceae bacterium]|nr:hypothetical protein [Parachlamydiaceae bacterium]